MLKPLSRRSSAGRACCFLKGCIGLGTLQETFGGVHTSRLAIYSAAQDASDTSASKGTEGAMSSCAN